MVPQAHSLIDIALWDMAARHAALPLYQLLGGARDKILSYASTPLLADDQAYIDYVASARPRKASRRSSSIAGAMPARDLPMCEAVAPAFRRTRHGADARCRAALRSCRRAHGRRAGSASWDFRWFEAPLLDTDSRAIARSDSGEHGADHRRRQHLARSAACSRRRFSAAAWSCAAGRCHDLRRHHADPQDHGAGRSPRHDCRDAVLGLHADPGGQSACHARLSAIATYFEQPVPYPAFEYRLAQCRSAPTGKGMCTRRRAPGLASISTGRQSKVRPS